MPNVILTQYCNRKCPYCFAKEKIELQRSDNQMGWEDLIYLLDLFQEANDMHISFLGGEPTLHSDFNDIILYCILRGFHLTIFTNGIINTKKLIELSNIIDKIPEDSINFVCNLNNPKETPSTDYEIAAVNRFLQKFGSKIIPGYTIYQPNFQIDFLFELIGNFSLRREIRLGLAHPILDKENIFINKNQIKNIVDRLMDYFSDFETLKIRPALDCGFLLCNFNDNDLGRFYRHVGEKGTKFTCGATLDFGVDMTVWSCFPLSSFKVKSVCEFDNLFEIRRYYENLHNKIRNEVGGIYEECDDCNYRENQYCNGGCVAHFVGQFTNEVKLPE